MDINLSSLPPLGDGLLAALNQLREADPIFYSAQSRCWIITGHEQVTQGFSGDLPLSSTQMPASLYRIIPEDEFPRRLPNVLRYMSRFVTNLDGEAHANLRRFLVKALNRRLVESLRPYVRERVGMLLDKAAARGELEVHEEISRMLPGAVILRFLGMAPEYLAKLKYWADGVTEALTSFNPEPARLDHLEVVTVEMLEVFRKEIEDRRVNPKADFITELLNTTEGDARLTMDDVLATLLITIIAGHDTTANSMTLGMRALAMNPEAWAAWRATPEKAVDHAIELSRYIAMSAALPRLVAEDFEWQGRHLKRGQLVMLMVAGGNRDPGVYDHPEEIDFSRANDRSLTFGPGLHHCIGHLLAKLQLSEFFTALVERFEGVEILEAPQFSAALIFRNVNALELRFKKRSLF
jgi:cytochrome P450